MISFKGNLVHGYGLDSRHKVGISDGILDNRSIDDIYGHVARMSENRSRPGGSDWQLGIPNSIQR